MTKYASLLLGIAADSPTVLQRLLRYLLMVGYQDIIGGLFTINSTWQVHRDELNVTTFYPVHVILKPKIKTQGKLLIYVVSVAGHDREIK